MPNTAIVFLANDAVFEQTLAFLESLRQNSPGLNAICIPFADDMSEISRLRNFYKFDIVDVDDRLTRGLSNVIYGSNKGLLKKIQAFSLPLDEFIFLDTDIVVLQDLSFLSNFIGRNGSDIIYSDQSIGSVYKNRDTDFTARSRQFNTGNFMSSRHRLSVEQIVCAAIAETQMLLDIGEMGCQDQTIINFAVDLYGKKALSFDEVGSPYASETWYQFPFIERDGVLTRESDRKSVPMLHFAGASSDYGSVSNAPCRFGIFNKYLNSGKVRVYK